MSDAFMEQTLSPSPPDRGARPGRSNVSRARLGISNLSIPLMWRDADHFKNKGDPREFSVFLVLQVGNEVKESRLVSSINRTCTDITIIESFVFENVSADFGLDVAIYAARTDSTDLNGTLRRRILKSAMTRSLGRKFGSSVKSQMTTNISDECYQENGGGGAFRLIGRCFLRLGDAAPNIKIHDLQTIPDADFYSPPLYGHICGRMVLQPNSVAVPIIEGTLTIRPVNEAKILQNVHCRLQGGLLRCSGGIVSRPSPLANFRIDADSVVQLTRQPMTMILTARGDSGRRKQLMVTAENAESVRSWKCALELQIADCATWGSFASQPVQLDSHAQQSIMPKGDGKKLYDQISIT
uniref:Anillin homology domain-containing protein n=1 Tax=Plectus sambesii TaxID=2011161 RepID=A0A914WZG1_9BILA